MCYLSTGHCTAPDAVPVPAYSIYADSVPLSAIRLQKASSEHTLCQNGACAMQAETIRYPSTLSQYGAYAMPVPPYAMLVWSIRYGSTEHTEDTLW
eukprot:893159-Rhodomonas_salina.2